ncbi:hypothetical protein [Rhizobium sp. CNPSo 4039]|uniref:hypothetical protein n=1 Tax=Rhizobium sp. CNPSo 4039 TaxID=3021409 RepID=UPI00255075EB|nr:hypothetical protein [Rhizobium sp. CNPSo 4039]MDK4716434.1 hypothetical protein [Rhizobium sp. CNPSo 4039]
MTHFQHGLPTEKAAGTDQITYPKSVDIARTYANRTVIRTLAMLVKKWENQRENDHDNQ